MIISAKDGDIFQTDAKHIAFAVNVEGLNDSGFAGKVAKYGWDELANIGKFINYQQLTNVEEPFSNQKLELGSVISKEIGDKRVCHSLEHGWGNNQANVIKHCFDTIHVNKEPIATVAIGTGLVGALSDADFKQILVGMEESEQLIILYSKYAIEDIKAFIHEGNTLKKMLK